MGFWDKLFRSKQAPTVNSPSKRQASVSTPGTSGTPASQPRVAIIDNTTDKDNWLVNKSSISVTVACKEMFGNFTVDLRPGEKKRITFNVEANAFPIGKYSYDNLSYDIGKSETWEIRGDQDNLLMVKLES